MITSILSAVGIFAVLVIVHEAGHFAMAKRVGVRVIRFSIGYPPRIWGTRRGETEYSIGATPLGGYVRMLGEEVGEEPKTEELINYLHEIGLDLIGAARACGTIPPGASFEDALAMVAERLSSGGGSAQAALGRALGPVEAILAAQVHGAAGVEDAIKRLAAQPPAALVQSFQRRAFPTQSLGRRVLIVMAGPLANIAFAPLLLTVVFMFGVPQILPILGEIKPGLPAAAAGLHSGDLVRSINGTEVESWGDVSSLIKSGDGSPIRFEIERQQGGVEAPMTLVIKPTRQEQKTIYGTTATTWVVGILPSGKEITRHFGPFGAARAAGKTTVIMAGQLVVGIASIFAGTTPVRDALGGPIMIAQMAGKEARQGFADLAMFTVMLSLELGFINLLPVPLLDGGHLLFFAFEGVRGKPLELRYREMMLQVGLFLLVALMAFVIFNDISRIVQG